MLIKLAFIFIIFPNIYCAYIRQSYFEEEGPIVNTKNGLIRGLNLVTYKQIDYYGFKGIPYAEPPIGDLRFEPPVPVKNWDGILNATTYPEACIQFSWNISLKTSEDCLYLNVFSPNISQKANLPVIVYFHGGAFESGDTNRLGPDNFMEQNVIIVTFNYRLTIFGFYTTNDEVAPGNAGLKDQILVLKWVHDNIASFGGNPDSVTLQGQTAGAASISYLMQSDLTKGLYKNAILQSGTSLNPWSLERYSKDAAFAVADLLRIKTNDTKELLTQLKQVPTYELFVASILVRQENIFKNPSTSGLIFLPTIEPNHKDAVITEKSFENFANGKFHRVPVLMGYNSLEMLYFYTYVKLIQFYLNTVYLLNPSNFCPVDMNIENDTLKYEIGKNISVYYKVSSPDQITDELTLQYLSEDQFVRSIHKTAELMSNYTDVYFYKNCYKGNINQQWPIEGVGSGEELSFLFVDENTLPKSDRDILMSRRLVKLWTNFARYSTPTRQNNNDPDFENLSWLALKPNDGNYLNINDDLNLRKDADESVIQFWDSIYALGHRPFDTY